MKAFLTVLCLASVEAARLVGEQCRGDPSLWCGSLQNATSCHALAYCLKHVWEGQRLFVKQTKECQYSQKLVTMVQQELAKDKGRITGGTFHLVASMCTVIQDASMRKQCKGLVADFLPQILKLMDSSMEPATVVAVMGLCPPQEKSVENMMTKLTDKGKKTASGTVECELCELLVNQVDQFLSQNQTEAAIQDFLDTLCKKLPSHITPQCLSFVNEYAAVVVKLLVQEELEPHQVCLALRQCPSSAVTELSVPTGGVPGIFCTVCEVLVGMLEVQLAKNVTEADVEKVLDTLCLLLPANLSSECVGVIGVYVPVIIDLLERELPPSEICQKIGLCNATAAAGLLMANSLHRDLADPVECDLCKVAITEINHMLGDNRTEQAIIRAVEKVCDVVQGDLRLQCRSEVENYGPAVLDLLQHMDDPSQVCSFLHLCASAPLDRLFCCCFFYILFPRHGSPLGNAHQYGCPCTHRDRDCRLE